MDTHKQKILLALGCLAIVIVGCQRDEPAVTAEPQVAVVDVKGEVGRNFYQRYRFKRFVGVADRLFIPMATLEKMSDGK